MATPEDVQSVPGQFCGRQRARTHAGDSYESPCCTLGTCSVDAVTEHVLSRVARFRADHGEGA